MSETPHRHIHDLFDLTGRVAIVTGGAGLLGKQFSEALCEAGARVVVASRTVANCEAWAATLRERGYDAIALPLDVVNPESSKALVAATLEHYGRLDILVNNAYQRGIPALPEHLTPESWSTWVDAGLSGAFYCAQAASHPMLAQQQGSIINIGSIYGLLGTDARLYPPGTPINASVAYNAIKGGIINLTRGLAISWAQRGIRVNCISPGGFPTETIDPEFARRFADRVPMGRMGNKTDLKGAVVYLASDASAYVTGHNLLVDGGWTAW